MANMSKNGTTGKYELNITPSASAQTKTLKVGGTYCDADIVINVDAGIIPSGTIEINDENFCIEWIPKTWQGLSYFYGSQIWSDGENIYYSYGSDHYVLDKSTSTWIAKTWYGLTNNFRGDCIWTDGTNIYYSQVTNITN